MTSLHNAGPDVDELVFLDPTPEEAAPRGRSRRVAVLGTAFAVCLTAVGVLSVQGVQTADTPAPDVVTASPRAAALQAASPTSTAQAPSASAVPPTGSTASAGASTTATGAAPAVVSPAAGAEPAAVQPVAAPAPAKPAAVAPAGTAALPAAPAPTAPQAVSTARGVLPVEKFGATGDGRTDDTAALQKALDSVPVGSVLQLKAGATYLHSDVLRLTRSDVTVSGPGATLLATSEARSSFHVTGSRVQVTGVTFALTSSTRRWDAPAQDKVRVWGNDVVLRDVRVEGAAAAGIFIDGSARFLLDRVIVSDSRADGIHMSNGARDGRVVSPVTNRTGDDGVAVVSYRSDGVVSARIQVTSPTVNGTTWGRGISVVGGNDISYTDVTIRDTDAAAVYLGSEAEYDTYPSQRVLVRGGTVTGANRNTAKDHGALMVYSGNTGPQTSDVTLQDLTVRDTRSSATWNIGVLANPGAGLSRVSLTRISLAGGPAMPIYTSTPAAVRVTGLVDDGAPSSFRSGW
ncbi:glycosyl hydrolase family 28-related protein [Modestobacter italicus]|uniref:glycosyl hydrolase family 28-related protein n=1 Tax=Modestobacter italicus (strain DSM 44449 / CECT 9708 / BC 501) TaxID=2732864 RepID=UPI001C9757F8|nr:glycosyl hydrolase family 28-related protein [Modestobacter italicus]